MSKGRLRGWLPGWLKPWLVPIWNTSVHGMRGVGDRIRAVATGEVRRCVVCGRWGLRISRRRVIPAELVRRWGLTERLARAVARKESLECSRCGAKLRGQRLAEALIDLFPIRQSLHLARSLAEWAAVDPAHVPRITEINRIEGLHSVLEALPEFVSSDYIDGAEPGAIVAGVRHEDLARLTWPDAAFEVVLTSETLEHVPDLARALHEIRRILVPGGWHLCTVPLLPGIPATFARARLADDGTIVDLAPPIRHPGGDSGWPVFTEFGADFPDLVRSAGFEVSVRFGPTTPDDVAQVYLCQKPLEG